MELLAFPGLSEGVRSWQLKRESLTTITCHRLANSCGRWIDERGSRRKRTSQDTGRTQVSRVEIQSGTGNLGRSATDSVELAQPGTCASSPVALGS